MLFIGYAEPCVPGHWAVYSGEVVGPSLGNNGRCQLIRGAPLSCTLPRIVTRVREHLSQRGPLPRASGRGVYAHLFDTLRLLRRLPVALWRLLGAGDPAGGDAGGGLGGVGELAGLGGDPAAKVCGSVPPVDPG